MDFRDPISFREQIRGRRYRSVPTPLASSGSPARPPSAKKASLGPGLPSASGGCVCVGGGSDQGHAPLPIFASSHQPLKAEKEVGEREREAPEVEERTPLYQCGNPILAPLLRPG